MDFTIHGWKALSAFKHFKRSRRSPAVGRPRTGQLQLCFSNNQPRMTARRKHHKDTKGMVWECSNLWRGRCKASHALIYIDAGRATFLQVTSELFSTTFAQPRRFAFERLGTGKCRQRKAAQQRISIAWGRAWASSTSLAAAPGTLAAPSSSSGLSGGRAVVKRSRHVPGRRFPPIFNFFPATASPRTKGVTGVADS